MEMVLPVANATAAALARVSAVFNAPLARAVVFGIHIDGNGHFSSSQQLLEWWEYCVTVNICDEML